MTKTRNSRYAIEAMEQTPITKTANYRMTFSDFAVYADATQGQIRITLPETLLKGMLVFVQKVDDSNNPVIVECSERESIDGARSLLATKRWEGWTLVADGPETWKVLSRSFPSQTPN